MTYLKELKVVSDKLIPDFNYNQFDTFSKEQFIKTLSSYISHLLDQDFQKLVQIMYRIDVSEKEFALTLRAGNATVVSDIAELIYERLVLKAKIRAKYKAN